MTLSQNQVYSQVNSVLEMLGDDYKNKVPLDILNMIKSQKDISYNPQYNSNADLISQGLSKQAASMVTAINLRFWCTPEEKERILKRLDENEREYVEKTKDIYNLSFLNKNKLEDASTIDNEKPDTNEEAKQLIKRENVFVRFINRIKAIFSGKRR